MERGVVLSLGGCGGWLWVLQRSRGMVIVGSNDAAGLPRCRALPTFDVIGRRPLVLQPLRRLPVVGEDLAATGRREPCGPTSVGRSPPWGSALKGCPRSNPLWVKGVLGGVSGRVWSSRHRATRLPSVGVGPGVTQPKSRPSGMSSRPRWFQSRSRLSSRARYRWEFPASMSNCR